MKLKRKITQTELDQLSKELQELYTKVGDEFVLNLEDTAFEAIKAEKKKAEEELAKYKEEEAERIKRAEERARKKAEEEYAKAKTDKDVEAVEKSWQEKYDKLDSEKKAIEAKHTDYVKKALIETAVAKIANEISTSPKLIEPHIRAMLDVDFTGESPKLFVTENGQRSAKTLDELKQAFIDNKDFSAIIKQSSASGGANAGNFMSGTQDENGKPKRFGELSDHELAQLVKTQNLQQE